MTSKQEIEQITAKWNIFFKNGKPAKCMTREQTAIMLEHQRVYNETLNDVDSDVNSHRFLASFRRLSIPIVWRTLHYMKTPQLVNYEPIADEAEQAEGHLMKAFLTDPLETAVTSHDEYMNHLDREAEFVAYVAQELAMEFDIFVLNELRSHAGIVCYVDPTTTEFEPRFYDIVEEVKQACGFVPNWVVASSPVAEYIAEVTKFESVSEPFWSTASLGIRHLGTIDAKARHSFELYENLLAPEYELLLGYKGSEPNTFQINPKILLEVIPPEGRNQKVQQARIRSQFNTKWPESGGGFYARVTVKAPD
jgi:hypothetical protein